MDRNGTSASVATALASNVFTQPGGPNNSAPLGTLMTWKNETKTFENRTWSKIVFTLAPWTKMGDLNFIRNYRQQQLKWSIIGRPYRFVRKQWALLVQQRSKENIMINVEMMKTGKAKYSRNNLWLISTREHKGNDCDQHVISKHVIWSPNFLSFLSFWIFCSEICFLLFE